MKVYYKHLWGNMFKRSIAVSAIMANVDEGEEDEAMDSGWSRMHWEDGNWFQSRNTRINILNYKTNRKDKRLRSSCSNIEYEIKKISDIDIKKLEDLSEEHMKIRKLSDIYHCSFEFLKNSLCYVILYKENKKIVAYSLLLELENSYECIEFCWNYHKPKIYLGKFNILCCINLCKKNNKQYLYLGDGYEREAIYKSHFTGFEFWTGEEWSQDKKAYARLCQNDSKVESIEDIIQCFK